MGDEIRVVPSSWFDEEFRALPRRDRERIDRRLLMLQARGWKAALAEGILEHLDEGIWKARVTGTGRAYRILFFPAPGRAMRLLVLASCLSGAAIGRRRVPGEEIERAKRRRDEWTEQHKERDDEG